MDGSVVLQYFFSLREEMFGDCGIDIVFGFAVIVQQRQEGQGTCYEIFMRLACNV